MRRGLRPACRAVPVTGAAGTAPAAGTGVMGAERAWGMFVDYWLVMGFLCLVYGLQLYCCFFISDQKVEDPSSWWRFL
jgi:hypothetical protein